MLVVRIEKESVPQAYSLFFSFRQIASCPEALNSICCLYRNLNDI